MRTIGLSLVAALAGCGPAVYIYDTCSGSEQCPGATTCQVANVTPDGFHGTFCTFNCQFDTDCPGDGYAAPVCEAGQCYAGSAAAASCPYGEACATDGAVLFCVP